jgi:hypothetical protein
MAEFMKNGLLVSSWLIGPNPRVKIQIAEGDIRVPIFTITPGSYVEHGDYGRHNVDMYVLDVAEAIARQQKINEVYRHPFIDKNDICFSFERGSDRFEIWREIAGDRARSKGILALGQEIDLKTPGAGETIIAATTHIKRGGSKDQVLYTVATPSSTKTLLMPKYLQDYVGRQDGDEITPPNADLAEHIDFSYTR